MENYQFETSHFALSEEGLHLLRNKYNYQTLSYEDIKTVTVKKGVESKNWIALLITGFVLMFISVYYAYSTFQDFNDPDVHRIYIESIVLPVLPFLLGLYCIYIAIKKVHVIDVIHSTGIERLGLSELSKKERINDFISFLKNKLNARVTIANDVL